MPIKLAVFDFDCTLSVFHVFNGLAGESSRIPPPFASTEVGQLKRVGELDQGGAFTLQAFGGEQRVRLLTDVLQELHRNGVTCVVCTKGLIGPVRKLLSTAGLLRHFKDVYGRIGETYGVQPYDMSVSMSWFDFDRVYLGAQKNSDWISKSDLVQSLAASMRVHPQEVVIIDDDVKEITSCRGVCQTVHVSAGQGLGLSEWRQLQSMVGMASPFAAHGRQDPTFGGSMRVPIGNGQIPGAFPRTNSQWVPGMSPVPPAFAQGSPAHLGYQQNVREGFATVNNEYDEDEEDSSVAEACVKCCIM
jgi:hypothetical protein